MSGLLHLFARGGWVMPIIVGLSVLLYSRCFRLLFLLRAHGRGLQQLESREALQWRQHETREAFRRQRATIGPMIAAAPLLGLLGTVSGMERAFGSLATAASDRSMEGLAGGISEVLVATESGLTIALPAMVLLYVAHRAMHRQVEIANRRERILARNGGAP